MDEGLLLATPASPPAAAWLMPVVMTMAIVFIGVVLSLRMRARVAARQAETPSPQERLESIRQRSTGRETLHAASSSYLDLTQRLAAQLDNKAERLDRLIIQADERIRQLNELQAEAVAPAIPDPAPPATTPTALDPLTRSVYELADGGRDTTAIARELNEQIGKIELILALREA